MIKGRVDITYAVSSLSRFSTCLRKGYLLLARKILGYLEKYPEKRIVIESTPLRTNEYSNTMPDKFKEFGYQFQYFKEPNDPTLPTQTIPELGVTISCDAMHEHYLMTGRSTAGILDIVGPSPLYWKYTI